MCKDVKITTEQLTKAMDAELSLSNRTNFIRAVIVCCTYFGSFGVILASLFTRFLAYYQSTTSSLRVYTLFLTPKNEDKDGWNKHL